MGFQFQTANMILYCEKWHQTVRFYRDGLGLPVSFENDWFVEFFLNAASCLSIAAADRASIESNKGAGITLALKVADIDSVHADLNGAGLVPSPIKHHPWNARVFYLVDPEGHRIEIWQEQSAG